MPRRKSTIQLDVDITNAQKQLNKLSAPLNINTGGGRGGGGAAAGPGVGSIRTGFGAKQAIQSGPFASYGVGGFVTNTAMFAAAGALSRVITEIPAFVAGLGEMQTALSRSAASGAILAGGAAEFGNLTATYTAQLRGYVSEGQAAEQVTKLLALGYADSEREMMRFVNAQRAAQLSTGRTAESIEQNLILALANADQSVGRIDQLGISMETLNVRVRELRGANEDLSLGEARRIGILDILNERYTDLAASGQLAADGLESLGSAILGLKEALAEGAVGDLVQRWATGLSIQFGGAPSPATIARSFDADDAAARRRRSEGDSGGLFGGAVRTIEEMATDNQRTMDALVALYSRAEQLQGSAPIMDQIAELAGRFATDTDFTVDAANAEMSLLETSLRLLSSKVLETSDEIGQWKFSDQMESRAKQLDSAMAKQAEGYLRLGWDVELVAGSLESSRDKMLGAELYFQQQAEMGLMSQTEAQLAFLDYIETEILNPNQEMLDYLADAAGRAAQMLDSIAGGIIGRAEGLAGGIVQMGGDEGAVATELDRIYADTEKQVQKQIDLFESGQITQGELLTSTAAIERNSTSELQAMSDTLKESQKIRKGTDRTNQILSKQNEIWDKFIGKMEKIPGLFTATDVTESEMALAKIGQYKDKPDEWLRQVRDEYLNNVDYEGIDVASILGRVGMGVTGDKDARAAQMDQLTDMWNTQEIWNFFAPSEILDPAVIEAEIEKTQRQMQGKNRIEGWLAAIYGTEEEVQAGVVLGILDPVTYAWDQALTDMSGMSQKSTVGVDFVNSIKQAIIDGNIGGMLWEQVQQDIAEEAAGIGGPVKTYDNQNADSRETP